MGGRGWWWEVRGRRQRQSGEVEWNGWEGEGGRGCGEGREGLH